MSMSAEEAAKQGIVHLTSDVDLTCKPTCVMACYVGGKIFAHSKQFDDHTPTGEIFTSMLQMAAKGAELIGEHRVGLVETPE